MNTNLMRYKIGQRVLVKRFDWDEEYPHDPQEVRILEKSPDAVKVEFLSDGWTKPGTQEWLDTHWNHKERWYVVCSLKDK
jgi:hypothetical protein